MTCTTGKFSFFEQVWMQISFHGIYILGFISIFQFNWIIAIGYLIGFPFLGILYFVMHLWLCPRCPHIKKHSSCTQLHPFLTKIIIKKNVVGSLRVYQKAGFFIILYGIFIFPLYWVLQMKYLWIPYLLLGVMHYLAYFIRFCKRCLNIECPQNLNTKLKHLKNNV